MMLLSVLFILSLLAPGEWSKVTIRPFAHLGFKTSGPQLGLRGGPTVPGSGARRAAPETDEPTAVAMAGGQDTREATPYVALAATGNPATDPDTEAAIGPAVPAHDKTWLVANEGTGSTSEPTPPKRESEDVVVDPDLAPPTPPMPDVPTPELATAAEPQPGMLSGPTPPVPDVPAPELATASEPQLGMPREPLPPTLDPAAETPSLPPTPAGPVAVPHVTIPERPPLPAAETLVPTPAVPAPAPAPQPAEVAAPQPQALPPQPEPAPAQNPVAPPAQLAETPAVAEPAEEPATMAQEEPAASEEPASPVEDTTPHWPYPTELAQRLENLTKQERYVAFGQEFLTQLQQLHALETLDSPDVGTALKHLRQLAQRTNEYIVAEQEVAIRVELQRVTYGLQRRLAIWEQAYAIGTQPVQPLVRIPPLPIVCPSCWRMSKRSSRKCSTATSGVTTCCWPRCVRRWRRTKIWTRRKAANWPNGSSCALISPA